MQKRIQSVAVALLLVAATLAAKDSKPHFLAPADVDWKSILKGPPAADSAEAKADLETVLDWQKKRTDEDVKRCKAEVALSPTAFQDALGDRFDAKTLPLTFKLLKDVAADVPKIADGPKEEFKRPRPPATDDRVKPCVPVETSGSYPSSHAARGELWGKLLAELYPDQRDKLIARGRQIGDDRVIAGMHFPTDVAAGQKLGDLIFEKLMTNDDFKTALAAAKAEVAAAKK
jgi:acid phosphatase (class A)